MATDRKNSEQDEVKDQQLNEASGGRTNLRLDDDQVIEDTSDPKGSFPV